MNRIDAKFSELAIGGRKGFIPFVTAGDPDLQTTSKIVLKLAELGADVIELGVPFSDPMADGPTIQASSLRALKNGVRLTDVLKLVRAVRKQTEVPVVLFSYLNPIYRYGLDSIAADASEAGVDGILITDVIEEEAEQISAAFRRVGIEMISLVAPTTSDPRLESIAGGAGGFIYAISRAGVTGARQDSSDAAEILVRRIREFTDLPVAVGFGISTRQQVEEVWMYADAAVVGSAIVKVIEESPERAVEAVADIVRSLVPAFANDLSEV